MQNCIDLERLFLTSCNNGFKNVCCKRYSFSSGYYPFDVQVPMDTFRLKWVNRLWISVGLSPAAESSQWRSWLKAPLHCTLVSALPGVGNANQLITSPVHDWWPSTYRPPPSQFRPLKSHPLCDQTLQCTKSGRFAEQRVDEEDDFVLHFMSHRICVFPYTFPTAVCNCCLSLISVRGGGNSFSGNFAGCSGKGGCIRGICSKVVFSSSTKVLHTFWRQLLLQNNTQHFLSDEQGLN